MAPIAPRSAESAQKVYPQRCDAFIVPGMMIRPLTDKTFGNMMNPKFVVDDPKAMKATNPETIKKKAEQQKADDGTRVQLKFYYDDKYHAHPELIFTMKREPGQHDLCRDKLLSASLNFHNNGNKVGDIRYFKVVDKEDHAHRNAKLNKLLKDGRLGCFQFRIREMPWSNKIRIDDRSITNQEALTFLKDLVHHAQPVVPYSEGEDGNTYQPWRTVSFYVHHKESHEKEVNRLKTMMTVQRAQGSRPYPRPYLRLFNGDSVSFNGKFWVAVSSRPHIFWVNLSYMPRPVGREFFIDFKEFLTIQMIPQVFEHEKAVKKIESLSGTVLDLYTVPSPQGTREYLICFAYQVPAVEIGDKLTIPLDDVFYPVEVIQRLNITPANGWTTFRVSGPMNKEKIEPIEFPSRFRSHPTFPANTTVAISEFAKIPVNRFAVEMAETNKVFQRYCDVSQSMLESFNEGDREMHGWSEVWKGSNILARGYRDFFEGCNEATSAIFRKLLDMIPTTFSTLEIRQALRKLPSGILVVEGPPGTGKTFLMIKMALAKVLAAKIVSKSKPKIVITASANDTCDVCVEKLHEGLKQLKDDKDFNQQPIKWVRVYSTGLESTARQLLHDAEKLKLANSDDDPLADITACELAKTRIENPDRFAMIKDSLSYQIMERGGVYATADKALTPEQKSFRAVYWRRLKAPEQLTEMDKILYMNHVSRFRDAILSEADIIIGTPFAVTDPNMHRAFAPNDLDALIIDEGGRMLEVDSMIATGTYRPKCVLVFGDSRQLQPPVLSSDEENPYSPQMELPWMTRVQRNGLVPFQLLEQRRQAAGNSRLVSEYFYGGKLTDHSSTAMDRRLAAQLFRKFAMTRLGLSDESNLASERKDPRLLISIPGDAIKDQYSSFFNQQTAAVTMDIVERLIEFLGQEDSTYGGKDILILSPYKAQFRLLTDALKHRSKNVPGLDKVICRQLEYAKIQTIDSIPGVENHFVIYDTVQSLARGHHMDPFRSNVAFSRARDGLIVIADLPGMKRWLTRVKNKASDEVKKHEEILKEFEKLGHHIQLPAYTTDMLRFWAPMRNEDEYSIDPNTLVDEDAPWPEDDSGW